MDTSALTQSVRRTVDEALAYARPRQRDPKAWGRLGETLHAHDLLNLALVSYRRALQLNPTEYRWWYLAAEASPDTKHRLDFYNNAYELRPQDYSLCIAYADELSRSGNFDKAKQVLSNAQPQIPPRGYGALGLARIALREGQIDESHRLLIRARGAMPRNRDVHLLLAQILHSTGDQAAATAAAELAHSLPRLRPVSEVIESMRLLNATHK